MKHFINLETLEIKDKLPGATAAYFQTVYSTFAYTQLKEGAEIPVHNHMQGAVDIILEGELEMCIAGNTQILKAGAASAVLPNAMHRAKAITDCKIVTVLHPKRDV
jgi:quercetin dioxygenase-like cupin family protein